MILRVSVTVIHTIVYTIYLTRHLVWETYCIIFVCNALYPSPSLILPHFLSFCEGVENPGVSAHILLHNTNWQFNGSMITPAHCQTSRTARERFVSCACGNKDDRLRDRSYCCIAVNGCNGVGGVVLVGASWRRREQNRCSSKAEQRISDHSTCNDQLVYINDSI